jgi:hypothetical protein
MKRIHLSHGKIMNSSKKTMLKWLNRLKSTPMPPKTSALVTIYNKKRLGEISDPVMKRIFNYKRINLMVTSKLKEIQQPVTQN